jgi:AAA domain
VKTKKEIEQELAAKEAAKAEADALHQAQMVAKLTRNAADLQHKVFEPMRWIVPDILPEGLSMLAGRPKIGKSWAALDIAISVSIGGHCLGKEIEEGDVLALFLEDTDRRLQDRITKVLGVYKQPWPTRLTYATEWPKLADGGIEFIRAWVRGVPKPRLIIVDVLERVRQRGNHSQSQYAGDYEALASLHAVAAEFQLSVLVLHHQRKAGAEDLIDTVSGTLGIGGALDSVLVLGRDDDDGRFLYGRGRDLEEFNIAVKLDEHCRWQNLGPKTERPASVEREQVIAAMRKHGGPMHVDKIARALGREKDSIKMLISRMHKAGELQRIGAGTYQLIADQAELDITDKNGREVI